MLLSRTIFACSVTATALPRLKTKVTNILGRTCIQTFREITQHELVTYQGEALYVVIEDSKRTMQRYEIIKFNVVVPMPNWTALFRFRRWRRGTQLVI